MSSLSLIGELLSVTQVPEMGWTPAPGEVPVDGGGRQRMNFRPDITFKSSTLVNLATPKKMCGFSPSFL